MRLALTACVTAIVSVFYFYLFENQKLYETYRCLIGARPWYACYLEKNYDFKTDVFGILYEGNTKDAIDSEILKYGAYEKHVLFFLRDVMQGIYSNNGLFLDAGANTGQHSMFMSRYAKEVHAFEPYEPVVERFRRMIETNKITNVVIHPVGLGNENKKLPFYKPPDTNLGGGSFIASWNQENSDYKKLEIVVGDEELKKSNVRSVDLIKWTLKVTRSSL
jgi:FkbM family methyltransferase